MAKGESPGKVIVDPGPVITRDRNKLLLRLLRQNRVAMIGLIIVTVMVSIGAFGPLVAPYDPNAQIKGRRLESPGQEFLLGSDNLGRDLLSRLLHGARLSIGMAALATIFIVTIAVFVGALAGYAGGLVDDLAMRVADVLPGLPWVDTGPGDRWRSWSQSGECHHQPCSCRMGWLRSSVCAGWSWKRARSPLWRPRLPLAQARPEYSSGISSRMWSPRLSCWSHWKWGHSFLPWRV